MRFAALLWQATYLRYIGASAISLGVDLSLFLLLHATGMPASVVSALSYSAGIVTHWLISSRIVFTEGLAAEGSQRGRQQTLFVVSALIGLAVTVAIVGLGELAGFDPRLAKLVAVGVSFQLTYLLRSRVVFA